SRQGWYSPFGEKQAWKASLPEDWGRLRWLWEQASWRSQRLMSAARRGDQLLEVTDAPAAASLGEVERLVRLGDQRARVRSGEAEGGHAQAGGDGLPRPGLTLERLPAPLGGRHGSLLPGAGQQDDKLLAPIAGHPVMVAEQLLQRARHPAQDLVAGRMTEGVVVLLELIHVQHDDGEGQPLPHRQGVVHLEPLVEVAAVADAGQPIGDRQLRQARVG